MKRVIDPNNILFDDNDYNRCCKDKKKYTTPYHAQYAIDECHQRNLKVNLKYYKCPYCKNYHLTSM